MTTQLPLPARPELRFPQKAPARQGDQQGWCQWCLVAGCCVLLVFLLPSTTRSQRLSLMAAHLPAMLSLLLLALVVVGTARESGSPSFRLTRVSRSAQMGTFMTTLSPSRNMFHAQPCDSKHSRATSNEPTLGG